MDLRNRNLSRDDVNEARGLFFYQPFILSDDLQSGIAYDWSHGNNVYQVDRSQVDEATWTAFDSANHNLRSAYEGWLDAIAAAYGDLSNASMIDTACAEGYFLHGLADRGVRRCVGYDLSPRVLETNRFLNRILAHNVEVHAIPYDMRTHTIPGSEPADIVISSAIMVHLSDPTFYLEFLGSITKKLLFLYSAFEDTEEMRITYERPRVYHDVEAKFPLCFSGKTTVSLGLVKFALAEMGFNRVVEVPPVVPLPPANHRAFIAIKD